MKQLLLIALVALLGSCSSDYISINGKDYTVYDLQTTGVDSVIVANDFYFSISGSHDGSSATFTDNEVFLVFKKATSTGGETRYYLCK